MRLWVSGEASPEPVSVSFGESLASNVRHRIMNKFSPQNLFNSVAL
jgi:hypothetical protein